jgi:hypothetical protein
VEDDSTMWEWERGAPFSVHREAQKLDKISLEQGKKCVLEAQKGVFCVILGN